MDIAGILSYPLVFFLLFGGPLVYYCYRRLSRNSLKTDEHSKTLADSHPAGQLWAEVDLLLDELDTGGHAEVSEGIRDAMQHVNGLTDGWWDFVQALAGVRDAHRDNLSVGQIAQINLYIKTVQRWLSR